MTHATAKSYMDDFINGKILHNNTNLNEAIDHYANFKNPQETIKLLPKWNFNVKVDGINKSSDRFDNDISAFCYYWEERISKFNKKLTPKYVKAMLCPETKIGSDNGQNGYKDVMQCMAGGDIGIYEMSRTVPANSKIGYDPNEASAFIPSGGFKALWAISGKKSATDNEKYTADNSKSNSRLSICFGIFWLGYKTSSKTNLLDGVKAYNGNGDKNYLDKINYVLKGAAEAKKNCLTNYYE